MTSPHPLGEFLQARRARLQPGDVGLPAGIGLRRTQGLRREELAALAGLSIQYYTRLEQGRENNPGGAVLDGLAAALRLNEEERAHLYVLANHADERVPAGDEPADREVRPGILALLERVRPWPACLLTRTGDVLAANPEAFVLFPGLARWSPERRNMVRYLFLHPAARALFVDWEGAASRGAAQLRTLVAADPRDRGLTALVEELKAGSREFAARWQRYEIQRRDGDRQVYRHPQLNEITLVLEVLRMEGGRRIVLHQPAEQDEAGRRIMLELARLAAADTPSGPFE
ncbi:helix-turn-helix domain-containing protein [Embleya scabrispora]|uniref:helix-turn-helix domain-containing protein n=1 Tax=Embleya scabrispora TaxID=159449 RepID=UPI00037E6917|nr:helix-turn-helix transcriptional regulator [Embleya scabrispora]MYS82557.1 helix-turn-helix domain-containing protein [Streptomyces sp. SID5474]